MGLMFAPSPGHRQPPALLRPEDVFLCWLLSSPEGSDLAAAADAEIDRLKRYRGTHPGPRRLEELFKAFRHSLEPAIGGSARQ